MKQVKIFFALLAIMLVNINYTKAQNDIDADTKFNVTPDAGITEIERSNMKFVKEEPQAIPSELLSRYVQAKNNKNDAEKERLGNEIQAYLEKNQPAQQKNLESGFHAVTSSDFNSYTPDWSSNDVQVHSGTVGSGVGSFRRIDLKQGEDGWMYMAVSRGGSQDKITIYASSNNGATWPVSHTLTFTSWRLFTLSMLVENRSQGNSNPDSTRILVYFTTARESDGNGAQLWVWSIRRNGTASFNKAVGIPESGNKYQYVSACSNGKYYTTTTDMHAVVKEATNAGGYVGLRHFRSTNWASSHIDAPITTTWDDCYPSIQFGKHTGVDSIYIAVERKLSADNSLIRVLAASEFPQNSFFTYFITSAPDVHYEKPCLTIVQQGQFVSRKMIVTYTKDNSAKYLYTLDGGLTWTIDRSLTSIGKRDYTWCSSDTNTAGGDYVMMCAVTQFGDSITVRRGNPNNMGGYSYKRNSNQSTSLITPVCAILNNSGSLSGAIGYVGDGPTNAFYNAEVLTDNLNRNPNSEISSRFSLSQNYPNPFNPVTNIKFDIPNASNVKLTVFDITGREIAELVNNQLEAGTYNVDFDASHLASGTYFYRIEAGDFKEVKKMLMVK
jgi:hypothetical protein